MKHSCFVVMPFGKGTEYVGKDRESSFVMDSIIRPAVHQAVLEFRQTNKEHADFELEVIRELDDSSPGNITESIVRHIAGAYLTIVDMTGRNPNVFFELGVRFSLKRNGTILLVQDEKEIPFNIKTYRTVVYDPLYDGPAKAIQALKGAVLKTLETLSGPPPATTDSLVFQALPEMAISGAGFAEELPFSTQVSWGEYWRRIEHITAQLTQLQSSGAYSPNLLLGISNGGLLLADTALRLVYHNSIPLICLWAFRSQEKFFENSINDALITQDVFNSLLTTELRLGDGDKIQILVMDDIVGTRRTFKQLIEYLRKRLGDLFDRVELRFVFVYTSREESIDDVAQFLLSEDRSVARKYKKVDLESVTNKLELPYRKDLHYGDVVSQSENKTSDTPPVETGEMIE